MTVLSPLPIRNPISSCFLGHREARHCSAKSRKWLRTTGTTESYAGNPRTNYPSTNTPARSGSMFALRYPTPCPEGQWRQDHGAAYYERGAKDHSFVVPKDLRHLLPSRRLQPAHGAPSDG